MAAASAASALSLALLPSSPISVGARSRPRALSGRKVAARARALVPSGGDVPDSESSQPQAESESDDEFEARLSKLQRKVTSGTGKKAEIRKARKEGGAGPAAAAAAISGDGGGKAASLFLPAVPLREPVSSGLPVQLGFNSYSERLNGKFAALGLSAILLVELATGTSFINFHDSSTIFLQVYFMLSAAALFIKFEKEKVSVWPK